MIAIRSNKLIQGIWRGGIKRKVSLYADDLLLFVSKSAISLPEALSVLEVFSQFSGYKPNLSKSKLFPINTEALNYTALPFKVVIDHLN